MDGLLQDLRHGWRGLRQRKAFALVAVATLALGIGANTAIFSAVNALLLGPLPVAQVDRVVYGLALREGFDPFGTSLLEYALFRDHARSLQEVGLGSGRSFDLAGSGEPERLRGAAVTASYLRTLGVQPVLGRVFVEDDDRPGGPAVALVGHEVWQRRLGGATDVIGRTLRLEDRTVTIVGVLPRGFDLPYSAEVWVPLQARIDTLPFDQRVAAAYELVARLRPGVSVAEANAEVKTLARALEQEYPQARRGWSYGVIPLRRQLLDDFDGRTHRSVLAVMAAVAFLLLICCLNVASLLLARGVAREAEIAIRLSLGAGRARLVRQLLAESLLLTAAGGAAGVLLAVWMRPALRALNPVQASGLGAQLTDFAIDARVLAFAVAITVVSGVVSGLVPALKAARSAGPAAILQRHSRGVGAAAGRRALRAIVVGEITVAATLLAGAALMGQSFARLQRIDLGFRPGGLLTMELPVSPLRHPDAPRQVAFMRDVAARVRALPGVVSAGMTLNLPMQRGTTLDSAFEAEGRPVVDPAQVPITAHRLVTPGYMETLGLTLVEGRFLDERDDADAPRVAVVSEELVRQAWPGRSALGRRVRRLRAGVPGPWMTVVGVVRDVKEDRFNFRVDRPVWYLPYAQQTFPVPVNLPLDLAVRTTGDPSAVANAVREAVHAVDPGQSIAGVMPMEEYLADLFVTPRFGAALMGALAALGLLLAALGLYGVMAYSVGQRRGEIGLRMALGARPRDVLALVIGEGARLVAAGLVVGIVGASALARLLAAAGPTSPAVAAVLYQVSPTDPATFGVVALVLATVALVAAWLPARRASRISPMAALQGE